VPGKWLYGPGKKPYSHLPEYETLRKIHAEFHLSAGEILVEFENAHNNAASEILNGKFRDANNQIKLELVRLFSSAKG